jgi:hypothetical protein
MLECFICFGEFWIHQLVNVLGIRTPLSFHRMLQGERIHELNNDFFFSSTPQKTGLLWMLCRYHLLPVRDVLLECWPLPLEKMDNHDRLSYLWNCKNVVLLIILSVPCNVHFMFAPSWYSNCHFHSPFCREFEWYYLMWNGLNLLIGKKPAINERGVNQ